jgi:UDP-N-acetylglucosamine acyltransferase
MSALIHPTAIVDPHARLKEGVEIGPYCVVGRNVQLDEGVKLLSHVVVEGHTQIGSGTQIFPFAAIGLPPQDLKYKGEASHLIIGRQNTIREYVTMNSGTEGGGMVTRVGDGGLFMVNVHIAHDCQVGNRVIFANGATLGGHVVVGDDVVIGGGAMVHQFVRIGEQAMIGGMSGVEGDVIPFGLVKGERAYLDGLNHVGLRRRGVDKAVIHQLMQTYQSLFTKGDERPFAVRLEALAVAIGLGGAQNSPNLSGTENGVQETETGLEGEMTPQSAPTLAILYHFLANRTHRPLTLPA